MDQAFRFLDAGNAANTVQGFVKLLRGFGHQLQDQIEPAAGRMGAFDLGQSLKPLQNSGITAWLDLQQGGRAQPVPARVLTELQRVTGYDVAVFQPFDPGLYGGARHAQSPGKGGNGNACILPKLRNKLFVEIIHFADTIVVLPIKLSVLPRMPSDIVKQPGNNQRET